ncbi:MAG: hypothetical protein LiPW16_176 [Microgenomates group bacterium LiPW_16]|nr:MAG: hypothetical protein LiPW16_176 [Microgenomates group bacterium LiPW_16]
MSKVCKTIFPKLCLLLILFLLLLRPITDADFGWHLAIGERIVKSGSVPDFDNFHFHHPVFPYIYYSWGSQVLIFLAYSHFGLWGVTLFLAFFASLGVFFIYKTSRLVNPKTYFAPLLLIVITGLLFVSVNIRPQVFSLFFFSLLFYLLAKNRDLFWVPVIFLAWVNLHPGYPAGVLLFLIFLIWRILQKEIQPRKAITLTLAVFASLLVNPYGLKMLIPPLRIVTNPVLTSLGINLEWMPLWQRGLPHQIFAIISIIIFVLIPLLKIKIILPHFLSIILFFLLSLRNTRVSMLLLVLLLPVVDLFLQKIFPNPLPLFKKKLTITLPFFVSLVVFCLALVLRIITNLGEVDFAYQNLKNLAQVSGMPYEAVEYIKTHNVPERLLNESAWGGYLLWQLPGRKVFYSASMDLCEVSPGRYLWQDYQEMIALGPKWQSLLEKYQIEAVLLPKFYPLAKHLQKSKDWKIIYEDNLNILFATQKVPFSF